MELVTMTVTHLDAIEVSGTWDSSAKTTYLLDSLLLLDVIACVYTYNC